PRATPRLLLCDSAGADGAARNLVRRLAQGPDRRARRHRGDDAVERRARRLSRRRRVEMVGRPARLHRRHRQLRQCRRPAAADADHQPGALRRDPVELPRALARRIQRADLVRARRRGGVGRARRVPAPGRGEGSVIMVRTSIATACVSALLVAGGASAASAQAPKLWRHGIIEPKSDAGFVLMVTQKDFAEKFGLKIETVKLKNGSLAVKAVIAGELDSVESGAGEGIVAAARGADLKIVGCNWPGLPHAIFARTTIASVEDLKGKTIAASAPGSLPELLARALLDKYGMTMSDVKITSLGGDLDRYKALLAGVVDAAVVSAEYLPTAPKDIKLLVAGRDVIPNFMRLCIEMTGKTLQDRRGQAARFLAAEIAAMRYAVANKDETVRLTREATGGKSDDPRPDFVFDETVKYRDYDPALPIPMDKLGWMQEQFVK